MACNNPRSIRVHDRTDLERLPTSDPENVIKFKHRIYQTQKLEAGTSKGESSGDKTGKPWKSKALSRVFSEDYENLNKMKRLFDPRGNVIRRWNKIFLVVCLVSLFLDPLFFFLPVMKNEVCMDIGFTLEVVLTVIRTIADAFYVMQIYIRFHTSFVAPSSRVFGRGELVVDPSKIASKYFRKYFLLDAIAALPLPQVLIWGVIPNLRGSTLLNTKNVLRFFIILQYIPRLFLIYPLSSQIVKAAGVVTQTSWAGAAYNLALYMLASHGLGACWYLLSIERQESCWRHVCRLEQPFCQHEFFDCDNAMDGDRQIWFESSNVTSLCNPSSGLYPFGIYADAVTASVTSSQFFNKYFYCLWWGLKNLSSLGQSLATSLYIGEICFAIIIATLGLILFALLIGNMQKYLQSTTVRLEEWRIKRTDTEQWMHHRKLPQELRQSIRKYDQYKWVATRGVDEEMLLKGLPLDLRRDIKRHLCYDLVRRVPLFNQMDEHMLDAICERLKPALCTHGTCLTREGDPVNEMLFVIRGNLDSYTTNGGRTGFFNSCRIGPGDFCGEELLTWALDARPSIILPSSTRTVRSISEVEAFALRAEDLKFVAGQFRRMHSKQLRHKFRFYSHQWRAWAACFIQAAWRRHKKRQSLIQLRTMERERFEDEFSDEGMAGVGSGCSGRKGIHERLESDSGATSALQKPAEPDFSSADNE